MINLFRNLNSSFLISRWVLFRPALLQKLFQSIFIKPIRTRFRTLIWGPYDLNYYPSDIRKNAQNILKNNFDDPQISGLDWPLGNEIDAYYDADKTILNLAGSEFNIDVLSEFWQNDNKFHDLDSEVIQAMHRFHWLEEQIAIGFDKFKLDKFLKLISDWIDLNNQPNDGIQWKPYNTSERICNWVVFWSSISSNLKVDKDLAERWSKSIQINLRHLVSNLEYPASGLINNHLLNNARALYIGGSFISDKLLVKLSINIFKRHLPKMIGNNGYLLESSSHYHFLISRSIEEVVRVAHWSGDEVFSLWLGEYSFRMQNAARRLVPPCVLSLNNMPRIGDVSPDIPFDWYDPRLDKGETGWQKVWGKILHSEPPVSSDYLDGWSVANNDSWFLLAYDHPSNDFYPSGHGHNDFGSFCVFFKELPVIVDIGRFSYDDSKRDKFTGIENSCHNIVRVDNKDFIPSGGGFNSVISEIAKQKTSFYFDNLETEMLWNFKANYGVDWSRRLNFIKESLHVCDDFISLGRRSHKAEGYYYFSPDVKIEFINDNQWALSYNDIKLKLIIEGADSVSCEEAVFYPSYGKSRLSHRLCWKSKFKQSMQIKLIINHSLN